MAVWPSGAAADQPMLRAARDALEGRGYIAPLDASAPDCERIAAPIRRGSLLLGAMALDVAGLTDQARAAFMARIAPGEQPASPAVDAPQAAIGGLATVVDLLAGCLEHRRFDDAAHALCNDLAGRLGLSRASLGVMAGHRMRLVAMSHSAVIDRRSNLARDLAGAMAEATEQDRAIGWSRDDGPSATAHAALARRHGAQHLLTVPLVCDGEITGAVTIERDDDLSMGARVATVMESLALVAGPLLELRRRNDRSLVAHLLDSAREFARSLLGPRHARAKLAALAATALLAWAALSEAPLHIGAPARIEGHTQRVVVAPVDGFIAEAGFRAGDTVTAGDIVARLDDRELGLELSRWTGELDQLGRQYRSALAAHDRAQATILNARIARTQAQVALLETRLERSVLRAPIDGLVIAGDLSQMLGSPVARGDVLFEIAPLTGYRVVMDVDERDIASVAPDQRGRVALEGLAGDTLPIVVERVTPVAAPRDGRNAFRVEARIVDPVDVLRPGMAGHARLVAGERSRLWLWTHRAMNWLRLKTWAWWPA